MRRVETTRPRFSRERWIGHGEVERLEAVVVLVLEMRCRKGVPAPDVCGGMTVEDHVHARQRPRSDVHLLTVDREIRGRRLVRRLDQQGARAAGWIVYRRLIHCSRL